MQALPGTLLILLVAAANALAADDVPERSLQDGAPRGTVTTGTFSDSRVFPGTTRPYSVYVPAQYDKTKPAGLMVFMDGTGYAKPDGAFRVPVVFDNLIHQQAMPVTISVFVNPGTIPATRDGAKDRSIRSFEYDSLGDRYARFLIDEFLPVALQGLNVSKDPGDRAVCGISSGGICAFTVAWERPDQFGKVMSHIGSFTNIRGGWAYPGLVRKSKDQPKPIKVYLQDGKEDLNNLHGNWPLGNQDLAAALQFAGYTYRLVMTDGGHSGQWAGEVFPDALRWLWSNEAESTHIPIVNTKPEWTPHPDAVPRDDVPHGTVEQMPPWESNIFAGTIRDWSIYVPAQYREDQPAALMIFQDGERMRDVKGRWRIPVVFDNLIARGDMPVTIAVFINPGHDKSKRLQNNKPSNRGYEYDSLGDRYVRFLLEEIIPEVEKRYRLSDDPNLRAIGGSSSGGICAFTAAW
jgi:enterochelin esterase-like enzyme